MIYLFVAEGFEEIEAVATVDVLRRAGLAVATVGICGKSVTGAHGITIECDITENEVRLDNSLDAVILPGGMPGTLNLEKSETVLSAIDFADKNGKYICAICAAPSILGHMGLLRGKSATCFPEYKEDLFGARVVDDFVCADGRFITARGPGASIPFGLKIVEILTGTDAHGIKESMQCP